MSGHINNNDEGEGVNQGVSREIKMKRTAPSGDAFLTHVSGHSDKFISD